MPAGTINEVLALLDAHYEAFFKAKPFADQTYHPVPCDTRAWSQIVISLLTGINGRKREKGTDLVDGSDVKAANCWSAIDTPRFNGVIPAGRLSKTSRKAEAVSALNKTPFIFFVLWDDDTDAHARCRVWAVRPNGDKVFRRICRTWYAQRKGGEIKSTNFIRRDSATTMCSATNAATYRTRSCSAPFERSRASSASITMPRY